MGSSGEESDREVLYHQLATEEIEEVEEERRRIFRPRINRNSIMELSIHNRRLFFICLAVIEAFGILAVILTIHWAINIKGGVTYVENMGIPFNWHPILMVIGLQAAFDSHNKPNPPKPNMYTLHSWVGLLAALLFGCQWGLGFSAFLFPKFSPEIRALLLPFHQYFGSSILALAVAAACMGHFEKMIWSNQAGYVAKDSEAQIVNTTGLFLILFAMGVTFLLSKFSKDQKPGVAS